MKADTQEGGKGGNPFFKVGMVLLIGVGLVAMCTWSEMNSIDNRFTESQRKQILMELVATTDSYLAASAPYRTNQPLPADQAEAEVLQDDMVTNVTDFQEAWDSVLRLPPIFDHGSAGLRWNLRWSVPCVDVPRTGCPCCRRGA